MAVTNALAYMGVVWWLGVADYVVEVLGRTGGGRRLKSRDREDSPPTYSSVTHKAPLESTT